MIRNDILMSTMTPTCKETGIRLGTLKNEYLTHDEFIETQTHKIVNAYNQTSNAK